MRWSLSVPWMMINRPRCNEDLDSASSRFGASICSRHGYLHHELLKLLASSAWTAHKSLRSVSDAG